MDMSQLDQVNNAKSTIVFLEIIVVDHFLKLVLSQTTCLQFVALGNFFANCKNCRPTLFLQIVQVVVPKYVSKFCKLLSHTSIFCIVFA